MRVKMKLNIEPFFLHKANGVVPQLYLDTKVWIGVLMFDKGKLLSNINPHSAHSKFNSYIRRLVSFERAMECVS